MPCYGTHFDHDCRGCRASEPNGAYEWSAGNVEGKPLIIRHFAPDDISDLYSPGQINEPILLYRGHFTVLAGEGTPDRVCEGISGCPGFRRLGSR